MMTISLGIVIAALIIILIRQHSIHREIIVELEDNLATLEEKNSKLYDSLERDKEIYGKDRNLLIAEGKSDKIELKHAREKLAELTKERSIYYQEMDNLDSHAKEMTPEELIELRSLVDIDGSGVLDFTGIYILYNDTMDKYYIGQSITVIRRSAKHFMEKGNEDIYEDYQAGEKWTVKLIALSNSGFKSINALEKHFIEYHSSTWNGYNRTIGNRT